MPRIEASDTAVLPPSSPTGKGDTIDTGRSDSPAFDVTIVDHDQLEPTARSDTKAGQTVESSVDDGEHAAATDRSTARGDTAVATSDDRVFKSAAADAAVAVPAESCVLSEMVPPFSQDSSVVDGDAPRDTPTSCRDGDLATPPTVRCIDGFAADSDACVDPRPGSGDTLPTPPGTVVTTVTIPLVPHLVLSWMANEDTRLSCSPASSMTTTQRGDADSWIPMGTVVTGCDVSGNPGPDPASDSKSEERECLGLGDSDNDACDTRTCDDVVYVDDNDGHASDSIVSNRSCRAGSGDVSNNVDGVAIGSVEDNSGPIHHHDDIPVQDVTQLASSWLHDDQDGGRRRRSSAGALLHQLLTTAAPLPRPTRHSVDSGFRFTGTFSAPADDITVAPVTTEASARVRRTSAPASAVSVPPATGSIVSASVSSSPLPSSVGANAAQFSANASTRCDAALPPPGCDSVRHGPVAAGAGKGSATARCSDPLCRIGHPSVARQRGGTLRRSTAATRVKAPLDHDSHDAAVASHPDRGHWVIPAGHDAQAQAVEVGGDAAPTALPPLRQQPSTVVAASTSLSTSLPSSSPESPVTLQASESVSTLPALDAVSMTDKLLHAVAHVHARRASATAPHPRPRRQPRRSVDGPVRSGSLHSGVPAAALSGSTPYLRATTGRNARVSVEALARTAAATGTAVKGLQPAAGVGLRRSDGWTMTGVTSRGSSGAVGSTGVSREESGSAGRASALPSTVTWPRSLAPMSATDYRVDRLREKLLSG